MKDYVCYYGLNRVEVQAEDAYGALKQGQELFQAQYPRRHVNGWEVHPYLAETVQRLEGNNYAEADHG